MMKSPNAVSLSSVLSIVLALLPIGCKDAGSEPDAIDNLTLSISSSHSHSSLASPGHQVLVITSVKVLVRDIRFIEAISDDSSDVKSGSFVLSLAVDGSVTNLARVRIRPGTYERLRLTLHKPEDDELVDDPDFRDRSGGDQPYSVIITGFYHETLFVFTSRVNARQEFMLSVPVEVPADGYVNVTLKVDPYEWFTIGEFVLDPFIQTDEIDSRIISSFADVFRDNDGNGQPD